MNNRHGLLQLCKTICLVLTLGVSMKGRKTGTFYIFERREELRGV